MIQRFIELGEGYSDIYELMELAKHNKDRLQHMMMLHTEKNGRKLSSLIVIMKPTNPGDFQALYTCLEGIPNYQQQPNKRSELFLNLAEELGKTVIQFDVKPSISFAEKDLYFQYLIGILRLNHYIPALK
ncbi:DUF7147 family protein [Sutcliffiella rhizosphaerae]|uniref:DUF7147 domain-containing protein n=1 Tax=Sutcliffiella rhizosphaerae TaxID=2880967 RepID=A0ABM8YJ54_9BACI|nr:methylthioribose kinase [Sutcliffiella rhizosphaerae]CAG9619832.1 hypothetical protein BACCIP111883_00600 [Sutcliffiella rhizosphaerae]